MAQKGSAQRCCPGDCGRYTREHELTCGDPECQQKAFWLIEKMRTKIEERVKAQLEAKQNEGKKVKKARKPTTVKLGELVQFPKITGNDPKVA